MRSDVTDNLLEKGREGERRGGGPNILSNQGNFRKYGILKHYFKYGSPSQPVQLMETMFSLNIFCAA